MRKHLGILAGLLLVAGVLFSSRAEAATPTNTTLQVNVSVTIPHKIYVQWGDATTVDDGGVDHTQPADRISAYSWTVKNAVDANLDLNETCASNVAANNKTINVSNTSKTGAAVDIAAGVSSIPAGWSIAGAAGVDTFVLKGKLGGANAEQTLDAVGVNLTPTAELAKATDQALILTVITATDITANAGAAQTFVVTLTASVD